GRFEREARAAARLGHPGIVTLFEAAVDDEGAYLVSEHVPGMTLEQLLAQGRLSDRGVVQIGIALCDALSHAHAHGVIHRDVKPSNVLIPDRHTTPAQLARLTDFGVARVVGADALTRTGDVIGTDAYMAPEQAQGLPAGASADLFSLALVLYEALSDVNPLRSGGPRMRRVGVHLPPLRRQRRDLPRELGGAVDRALRPRGGERGTLQELRGALVASVGRVHDEPGVVADPWPSRTARVERRGGKRRGGERWDGERWDGERRGRERRARERWDGENLGGENLGGEAALPAPEHSAKRGATVRTVRWPTRVLAGAAAAGLGVWVVRQAPGALPVPPGLAAPAAGLVVAAAARAGWLILAALVAATLALHSQPEMAAAIVAGALVPVALSPRDGPAWPLAAAAPALATLGLATAWPALAGLSGRAHRRAALAATGGAWNVLWLNGLTHPHLTVGTLICCGIWALAALTLPWTRSRRWPALECVRLTMWAIALGLGTTAAAHLGGPEFHGSPLLGALIGTLVAFVTRWSAVRSRWGQMRIGSRAERVPSP
ncbi:MAG: serine/threonine protein kinase, partial [Solirubrobacterales bacterium]|nr:serine/threonine protein kinase [Solirubrobacterales bacterium]